MNRATNAASKHLIRDIALVVVGARALRAVGIKPSSFWGGTGLGFCAGQMSSVYGFDARKTLSVVEGVMGYEKIDGSFETTSSGAKVNVHKVKDKK